MHFHVFTIFLPGFPTKFIKKAGEDTLEHLSKPRNLEIFIGFLRTKNEKTCCRRNKKRRIFLRRIHSLKSQHFYVHKLVGEVKKISIF